MQIVTVDHLLPLFARYCEATGAKRTGVSLKVFGSGSTIGRLDEGGDVSSRMLARAFEYLSEHWPEDEAWPAELPRPTTKSGGASTLEGEARV